MVVARKRWGAGHYSELHRPVFTPHLEHDVNRGDGVNRRQHKCKRRQRVAVDERQVSHFRKREIDGVGIDHRGPVAGTVVFPFGIAVLVGSGLYISLRERKLMIQGANL